MCYSSRKLTNAPEKKCQPGVGIPAPEKPGQEGIVLKVPGLGREFEASLNYTVRPYFKKTQTGQGGACL